MKNGRDIQKNPADPAAKPLPVVRPSRLKRLISGSPWLLTSALVIHFGSFIDNVQEYGYGTPLYLALASLLGFLFMFFKLTFYIPYNSGKRIDVDNWQTEAPRSIQFATACGFSAYANLMVMLWPAYTLLTPGVLFILSMGVISALGVLF